MKNLIRKLSLIAFSSLLLFACKTNAQMPLSGVTNGDLSAHSDVLTTHFTSIESLSDLTNFTNFKITYDSELNQYYVQCNAVNTEGKAVVARTNCSIPGGVDGEIPNGPIDIDVDLTGESCTGDKCSHCAFKTGGACDCKKLGGNCNHKIWK